MRPQRLPPLLAIMAGLAATRLWTAHSAAATQVVEPALRPDLPRAAATPASPYAAVSSAPMAADVALAAASGADDAIGNPFAARRPPQPVAPPTAPVAAFQPPPPDPLQSYHVIGTVDDQGASGVFVDTPSGVELARAGDTLGGEFKVKAVTRQSLTLEQTATRREFTLSIPVGGAP